MNYFGILNNSSRRSYTIKGSVVTDLLTYLQTDLKVRLLSKIKKIVKSGKLKLFGCVQDGGCQ